MTPGAAAARIVFGKRPANWAGQSRAERGDSLFFGGTSHTSTTNNFATDTAFNNFTFNSPAGFFVLAGNEVALCGNITNNQVVTPQTISLPLLLSATPDSECGAERSIDDQRDDFRAPMG